MIGQMLPVMGTTVILWLLSGHSSTAQLLVLGFVFSIYDNVLMIVITVVALIIVSLYADLKLNRAKEGV